MNLFFIAAKNNSLHPSGSGTEKYKPKSMRDTAWPTGKLPGTGPCPQVHTGAEQLSSHPSIPNAQLHNPQRMRPREARGCFQKPFWKTKSVQTQEAAVKQQWKRQEGPSLHTRETGLWEADPTYLGAGASCRCCGSFNYVVLSAKIREDDPNATFNVSGILPDYSYSSSS